METNTANTVTASRTDQGGPAFPTNIFYNEKIVHQQWGMSLRDYFAGQALLKLMDSETDAKLCAIIAYNMADAMLKARNA